MSSEYNKRIHSMSTIFQAMQSNQGLFAKKRYIDSEGDFRKEIARHRVKI